MFSYRLGLGVAAVELAIADDTFRFRADVDEDLVLVDADDVALDHIAVLQAPDLARLLVEQLFHGRRLGSRLRGAEHGRRRERFRLLVGGGGFGNLVRRQVGNRQHRCLDDRCLGGCRRCGDVIGRRERVLGLHDVRSVRQFRNGHRLSALDVV